MRAAGLEHGGPILADSKIHRFKADGDSKPNSWYVLHAGPPGAGAFGCWKRDVKIKWCDGTVELTPEQSQRVGDHWQEVEREREREEQARHAKARQTAAWILKRSRPARTLNRYLSRKLVAQVGDAHERGGALVVPLRDVSGVLHTLQFIQPDGSKRFLRGGRVAGCFTAFGNVTTSTIVVCEGFATGASIHEATGLHVVCAMHAGNLDPVVASLRVQNPDVDIIIAADNDQWNDGNPGLTKAMATAQIRGARIAVAEFSDTSTRPTDFNDLHQFMGLEEVKRQVLSAAAPPSTPPAPNATSQPKPNFDFVEEQETLGVMGFPLDALPPTMALIAAAVARVARVPDRLTGPCVIGLVSAAIGAGLEIESDGIRTLRGNLFILVSAETGAGKSRTFELIAAHMLDYQERLQEQWRKESGPRLQSQIKILDRQIANLEKKAGKTADDTERERLRGELEYLIAERDELARHCAPPLIIAQDATTERLTAMMEEQAEVLFSASADCRKVIDNLLGRYSANKSTDESFYLAGFSGDHVRVDRGSRPPVNLRRPCLGLLWFGQPDLVDSMLGEDSLSASGFLPRLLLCHSHAAPQRIDGEPTLMPESTVAGWSGLVGELLATYHQPNAGHVIKPNAEARQRLVDYHNVIVERRGGDLADVGGFAARWAEQAWRLALVFHAGLHGADAHNHELDSATAENAIRVAMFFAQEQLDILAKGRRQAAAKVDDEVMKLLEARIQGRNLEPNERELGQCIDWVTARSLVRARITSAEAARSLLDRMEGDGLLNGEDITPQGGGKTTRIYRRIINPVPE